MYELKLKRKKVDNVDSIQNIAISKIADILSSEKLIVPEIDIWRKIFYNAGLSETYEEYRYKLTVTYKQINWEDNYYNNDRCYSALLEILLITYQDFKVMTKLFNSILDKFSLCSVFVENIYKHIKSRPSYNNYFDIIEHLKGLKSDSDANYILQRYPSNDFLVFKRNLNILSLDISIQDKNKLVAIPFTFLSEQVNEDTSLINKWLQDNYPNVHKSYEDAKKAYGSGDGVGCLTHCRNVITGFFSYKK